MALIYIMGQVNPRWGDLELRRPRVHLHRVVNAVTKTGGGKMRKKREQRSKSKKTTLKAARNKDPAREPMKM
jgi:hypothetical protein